MAPHIGARMRLPTRLASLATLPAARFARGGREGVVIFAMAAVARASYDEA
jgi:hypothetical protein